MLGFVILVGFNYLGFLIQHSLAIPLPGNVIGLILFTGALFAGWIKLEWVEVPAQFLLKHLMLFFAPYVVGVMVFFGFIHNHALTLLGSWAVSSLLVLAVTGWVTQGMMRTEGTVDHAESSLD